MHEVCADDMENIHMMYFIMTYDTSLAYVLIMFSIQYHVCLQNLDHIDARGMCTRHREHTNDVFYNDIRYIISKCMTIMFSVSCLPPEPSPHSYTRYMVHGIENITIIYIHICICMYVYMYIVYGSENMVIIYICMYMCIYI